jgi:carbonic anhydrase
LQLNGARRLKEGNIPDPMSAFADLLNKVNEFEVRQGQPGAPRLRLSILTCMDARIDPAELLGLDPGDAHVIRNAGGVATDDAIRSLAMSQRLLDTTAILVIQHTGCGIHAVDPAEFSRTVADETGDTPTWSAPVRPTPEATLQLTLETLRASSALPHRELIEGTILDLVGAGKQQPA